MYVVITAWNAGCFIASCALQNALNSIQLGARFATVQKVDHNGFSVSTTTKDFQ